MTDFLKTRCLLLLLAVSSLVAFVPRPAQAYQVDCAILLCLSGGWPASAPCAHARAVFIRRITPWPIEPPLQIWRCPMRTVLNEPGQLSPSERFRATPLKMPHNNRPRSERCLFWHPSNCPHRALRFETKSLTKRRQFYYWRRASPTTMERPTSTSLIPLLTLCAALRSGAWITMCTVFTVAKVIAKKLTAHS